MMNRYCVIGAGAAGISALEQLRKAGYEVDCYEKTDRVGGHWHTDYDAMHLISSRDTTVFEDFPMPDYYPHFPRRDQIRDYIESYAQSHGHYDIIQFNTRVEAVVPRWSEGTTGSAGWTVTLESGERVDYEGVFVANGHLWDQKIPEFTGTFTGKQVHSGSYKNKDDIEGDRVLVVGSGNSGCDLAVDLAQCRVDIDIVIRSGTYFESKTYFGKPRYELEFLRDFTPDEQDVINRLLAKVSLGEWSDYPGLPEPQEKTLAKGRSVANDLLLYWIQHGRIHVVPGIERLDGKTVYFTDGTSGVYDTILWATGFHVTIPFIEKALIRREREVPLRYAAGIVPVGLEKLYFIGLTAPRGPMIPIYGQQTKLAIQMMRLHEASRDGYAEVEQYLAARQNADPRLDIERHVWKGQMNHTRNLLMNHPHSKKVGG